MNKEREENLSKFMSLLLRHNPKKFNLKIDEVGLCVIKDLLNVLHLQENWKDVTLENIQQVVKNCSKQRYEIVGDKIKARYGHSFKLPYKEGIPPEILYHGTNIKALPLILEEGIKSMKRPYVHLSETEHFATLAGQRRGKLVLLKVDTRKAMSLDYKFYHAGNEVWLTEYVPTSCIIRKEE